jgi:hypothetical protein
MKSPRLNFPLPFTTNLQAHEGLTWISTCYCSPPVANATPLAHVCTAVAFAVAFEAAQCHRVWQHAVRQDA